MGEFVYKNIGPFYSKETTISFALNVNHIEQRSRRSYRKLFTTPPNGELNNSETDQTMWNYSLRGVHKEFEKYLQRDLLPMLLTVFLPSATLPLNLIILTYHILFWPIKPRNWFYILPHWMLNDVSQLPEIRHVYIIYIDILHKNTNVCP